MKKIIVVKIGGVASDNLTPSFFEKIEKWQTEGHYVVIVHGGGHYITEMMNKLNISVEIKEGLRITNKDTLAITKMVLIGQVQTMITTKFQQKGFSVVGLNASSGHFIVGDYLNKTSLGAVGKIVSIDTKLLKCLLETKHLPIIAPLGMTEKGDWLNINADHVACKIAEKLKATELYLLTDVQGVKKENRLLKEMDPAELVDLKKSKAITGGMLPKVESAVSAVENGVKSVHITNELMHSGTVVHLKEVFI